MKEKRKDKIIVFLVAIVLVLVLVVLLTLIKGKSIDTNSSLINEIYAKLGQNDLSYCVGLETYSIDTIDYDKIDPAMRICSSIAEIYEKEDFTLMKIDKSKKNNTCSIDENVIFATDNYEEDLCSVYRIDKSRVEEVYQNIYGKKIEEYSTVNLNNTIVCYPTDAYYYCGLSERFTVTVGNEPETFRGIKEARKSGNKIIIYDYFIKILNDECYTSYKDSTLNSSCTAEYKTNKDIDFNFLKRFGTMYKHTFIKDADNVYHWIQSEPK